MPIVVTVVEPVSDPDLTLPVYAVVGDVRAKGIEDPPDNDTVEAAIRYASRVVDAYAGPFGGSTLTSVRVADVRTDDVVLPFPATENTAVLVGTYEIPETSYETFPWGVRLSGAPGNYVGRGVTVTVEGDFTSNVPELVREATVLIAIDYLDVSTGDGDSSVIPALPNTVKSFSVEGLSVAYKDDGTSSSSSSYRTTGNVTADQLLALLGTQSGGVV